MTRELSQIIFLAAVFLMLIGFKMLSHPTSEAISNASYLSVHIPTEQSHE